MQIKPIRLKEIEIPNNVLMAPLAGYTCYPFRMMCQEMGAGLCFTEMVSANALKYNDRANKRLLFTTEKEKIKAVQLLGDNPQMMQRAVCSELLEAFDIIDINMGCPVPNVFKSGQGSALMLSPKKAAEIIRACKKSGKIVTVKTRIGIQQQEPLIAEFARSCEDAGADMISIHGRSRSMMYEGTPCFDQIQTAKAAVSIPVVANGGIWNVQDAETMMQKSCADGVMIGRYAIEHPHIFAELTGKKVQKNKYIVLKEQMELTASHYDDNFTMAYMRRLASFFMKKQVGCKQYKQKIYQCGNLGELDKLLQAAFLQERKEESSNENTGR